MVDRLLDADRRLGLAEDIADRSAQEEGAILVAAEPEAATAASTSPREATSLLPALAALGASTVDHVDSAMGQIAAEAAAKRGSQPSPETPNFGKIGFLAVSDSEVALVKGKQGAFKSKLTDEVLARNPRTDVASAELGSGKLALPLTITFNSGETWRFDIPRAAKKTAGHVVSTLGG